MTKKEFSELVNQKIIYLDGATGSNLIQRGMPVGVCPEKWILENPETLIELQKSYVESGSNILYAPTFSCNRIKLSEYGLEERIGEFNMKLVALTRTASGNKALVAGNLTMTGKQLKPIGNLDFEELITVYKEQIQYILEAGVDLFVVETVMSLQEMRAAVIAIKECCNLPILSTMTFESDGRTLFGTDAKTAAIVLESLGVDAIGANCSTGPKQLIPLIREISEVTTIPVIAKPNAGLPCLDKNGKTVYSLNASDFAVEMIHLVKAGASILGGCCGTTPEHILELVKNTENIIPNIKKSNNFRYLTSERMTVAFSLEDNFILVGERINPTGKKKLQEDLKNNSMNMVMEFAEEQEVCGARVLDINMGMSGINEKDMILDAMDAVATVSNLPLSIDSSHVDIIECALRRYPGRALINSISLESAKCDELLKIAKKYGAMFILLPLSDNGLPKDIAEKKAIINTVREKAYSFGLHNSDIIVDGLVTTVGANKTAALETLETIRYCKEQGLATVCGLSNISFGLPGRSYVNAAFLTMAIQAGLTMAIANPSQDLLVLSAMASDLLLNKEDADLNYIEAATTRSSYIAAETEKSSNSRVNIINANKISAKIQDINTYNTSNYADSNDTVNVEISQIVVKIGEAVLKGRKNQIIPLTKDALELGLAPNELLDNYLLPAINEVGNLFDKGKYFLPQLIASAETMKLSIEILEPLLIVNKELELPTVIIATVEGDIHDIGKNLVALMLKNYGFKVIDLGKDVSKEKIIEAAIENNASVIALSALMTTTMQQMKKVIDYAKEKKVDAKIIIGGAVITQDYAEEIGAAGYSKDAADAVKLTKRLMSIEF